MDARPLIFKRVSDNDTVFFAFETSNTKFVLYDSGLGDPIKYGSQKLILGELENQIKKAQEKKRKKFKVYWLIRDAVKGWKENPQRPAGYSEDGIVDLFQKLDKNSPNVQTPKFKKISFNEPQFYWFDLGSGKHILYDSDMGSAVSYGSIGFVYKTLDNVDKFVREGKQTKYVLWYFTRSNADSMWEHKQPKRIPNWKVESTDKKKINDEKKKEDEEDKK